MSESSVQKEIRLDAAYRNIELWRNNSGACVDTTGRHIRYGLANESKQLNERIKSSDLIGIVPIVITPEMVGKTIGVFAAIECKAENWCGVEACSGEEKARAEAQARFHGIVRKAGGIAGFANSVAAFHVCVARWLASAIQ